jgi:uncharacterized protein (DUF1684 family)
MNCGGRVRRAEDVLMNRFLFAASCLAALVASGCNRNQPGEAPAAAVAPDAAAVKEAADFRAEHETSYRENWSTLAALHFLTPGSHTAGSAASNDIVLPPSVPPVAGRFTLSGDTVRFEPQPGVAVTLRGQPLTAPKDLVDDGQQGTDVLTFGTVDVVVHRSGERKSLRVWDPNGELAKGFLGFSWFPIQPEYRVIGRYVADAAPRTLPVLNTFGDTDMMRTEGIVTFTLQGRELTLRPFTTGIGRLWFVFKDESSGEETYDAARFLYADRRDDGTVVLDFNQAYNPPCAFNPYTTCPIPLAENRLPLKVLAGERDYPVHPAPVVPPAQ